MSRPAVGYTRPDWVDAERIAALRTTLPGEREFSRSSKLLSAVSYGPALPAIAVACNRLVQEARMEGIDPQGRGGFSTTMRHARRA